MLCGFDNSQSIFDNVRLKGKWDRMFVMRIIKKPYQNWSLFEANLEMLSLELVFLDRKLDLHYQIEIINHINY